MSGENAPGGNGTFQLFGIPAINQNGQVAFGAFLSNTQPPDPNASGVYLADGQGLVELVRVGDPAPDGNGTFALFSGPNVEERFAINADGTVAFLAQLQDTAAALPGFDDSGLFLANAASGVTQLVRLGDAAPDGNGVFGPQDPEESGEMNLYPPGLDDAGGASFFGLLFQTSGGEEVDDRGVFHADTEGVTQLARIGSMVPGTSETFETIETQIASNAAGEVALVGFQELEPSLASPSGLPPFPTDLQRIYVDDGSTFTEHFRTGGIPPDGDGMITFVNEIILADSGEVVFQAMVDDTIDFLDSGPRVLVSDGMSLVEIARQSEVGPGEVDLRFADFIGLDANGQGQVAVSAALETLQASNRTTAIYLYEEGVLSLLVREGDLAPDGNRTFADVAGPVFLNENGAIAFFATLEGTASPPGDDAGIFVVESNSLVRRIVREGQPLEGSTVTYVSDLGSFVFDTDDLSLAGVTAFNDAGQVAFVAGLADTRSGVFVNVPEPTPAALAISAVLVLAVLAWGRRVARAAPRGEAAGPLGSATRR